MGLSQRFWILAFTWWALALAGTTSVIWRWILYDGPHDHGLAHYLGLGDSLATDVVFNTIPWRAVRAEVTRRHRPVGSTAIECAGRATGSPRTGRSGAGLADLAGAAAQAAEVGELRRLERDIHDGPQQRLVRLSMDLGRALKQLDDDPNGAKKTVRDSLGQTRETLDE